MQTLDALCQKTGWQVHAYGLMSSHSHLVAENAAGQPGRGNEMVAVNKMWPVSIVRTDSESDQSGVSDTDALQFLKRGRQMRFRENGDCQRQPKGVNRFQENAGRLRRFRR